MMFRLGLYVSWLGLLGPRGGLAREQEAPIALSQSSAVSVYQPCEPSDALMAIKEACARGDTSTAQRLSLEAHSRVAAAEARLLEVVAQRKAAMIMIRMRRP